MATTVCSGQTSYTNIGATLKVVASATKVSSGYCNITAAWTIYTAGSSQISGSNGARYLHLCNSSGTRLQTQTMTAASHIWNTQSTYSGDCNFTNISYSGSSITIGFKVTTSSTSATTTGTLCWTGSASVSGGSPSLQTAAVPVAESTSTTLSNFVVKASSASEFIVYAAVSSGSAPKLAIWTTNGNQGDIKWVTMTSGSGATGDGWNYNYWAVLYFSDFSLASSNSKDMTIHCYDNSQSTLLANTRCYFIQKLNYNANGGTCLTNYAMKTAGENIGTLPTVERSGYTLKGWYTAASGGTQVTSSTKFSPYLYNNDGVTIYAQWEAAVVTKYIYYRANGSTSNSYTDSTSGSTFTTRGSGYFSKTGYTQNGWTTSTATTPTSATYALNTSYSISSNLTLYPSWTAQTYSIYYYTGSLSAQYPSNTFVGSQTKTYGTSITLASKSNWYQFEEMTRSGYTFSGWSTSSNGSTYNYAFSGTYSTNAALTLYPYWSSNTYYVYYCANGTTTSPTYTQSHTGTFTTRAIGSFVKSGYTQIGWTTSTATTPLTSTYNANTQYSATSDLYLRPAWVKNVTLTFDPNGGTCSETSRSLAPGANYGTLPTPTRSGYNFLYWANYENGQYWPWYNNSNMATYDVTLIAMWEAITYTANFYNEDGTFYTSVTSTNESSPAYYIYLPAAPTKEGYKVQWQRFDGSNSQIYDVNAYVYVGNNNHKYKAYYTEKDSTITCYVDQNTKYATYSGTPGTTKVLPTPSKTGHSFDGWYANTSYTGTKYSSYNYPSPGGSNVDLDGRYVANNYTVTFDAQGGTVSPSSISVRYNQKYSYYTSLPTPVRTGYPFEGWYTSTSYTTQVTDSTIYKTAGNQTLYAKWGERTNVACHFYENETKNLITTLYLAPASKITLDTLTGNATINGYKGKGYEPAALNNQNGAAIPFPWNVTDESDSEHIYVIYTGKSFIVSYDAGMSTYTDGAQVKKYTNKHGNKYVYPSSSLLSIPPGYTFSGWRKSDGSILNVAVSTFTETSDQTLTAAYEPITYKVTYDWNFEGAPAACVKDQKYADYYKFPTSAESASRPGYTFKGWFTTKDGTQEVTEANSYATVGNQTLYAHWQNIVYQVILKTNGGKIIHFPNDGGSIRDDETAVVNLWYDKVIDRLPSDMDIIKEGASLQGWLYEKTGKIYNNGDIFDIVDTSVVLQAVWETGVKRNVVAIYNEMVGKYYLYKSKVFDKNKNLYHNVRRIFIYTDKAWRSIKIYDKDFFPSQGVFRIKARMK